MSEGGQTHDGQQELFTAAARIAREAESKSTKWAPQFTMSAASASSGGKPSCSGSCARCTYPAMPPVRRIDSQLSVLPLPNNNETLTAPKKNPIVWACGNARGAPLCHG